jgi:gliding motility-associated-like protein
MDKGYYDVKLLVMNKFGCEDSLTKTTRVYGLPIAHFNNSVACTGDPTYFTDNSSISDTTAGFWAWNFGDPNSDKDTSNLQEPIYRYRSEGDFPVRFIVKDYFGCMDTVDSTSAFTFTENFDGRQGKVKLNNQSNGATLYNWDFGNGTTSTEDNPIISYTEDGTYIIKLIALNQFECSDTTFFEYKLLFKGLYVPNAFSPTNTILAVRLFQPVGMNLKQYHVTVFDQWGHIMWESSALDDKGRPSEGWDGTYEGEFMPQGNYMWKIKALFVDDSPWNGSDIGMGEYSTMGTVTLIR